jgi:hypothetical protein
MPARRARAFQLPQACLLVISPCACDIYNVDVIRRHISLFSLANPFNLKIYLLQLFLNLYSRQSYKSELHYLRYQQHRHRVGWHRKCPLIRYRYQQRARRVWFNNGNPHVPRDSTAYDSKAGDYVASNAVADGKTGVQHVMQSIRMRTSTASGTIHGLLYFRIKLGSRGPLEC